MGFSCFPSKKAKPQFVFDVRASKCFSNNYDGDLSSEFQITVLRMCHCLINSSEVRLIDSFNKT